MAEVSAVWVVRGGDSNELASQIASKGAVAIGWPFVGTLKTALSRDDIRSALEVGLPGSGTPNSVGQVFRFAPCDQTWRHHPYSGEAHINDPRFPLFGGLSLRRGHVWRGLSAYTPCSIPKDGAQKSLSAVRSKHPREHANSVQGRHRASVCTRGDRRRCVSRRVRRAVRRRVRR
jgi:hypothetical protein